MTAENSSTPETPEYAEELRPARSAPRRPRAHSTRATGQDFASVCVCCRAASRPDRSRGRLIPLVERRDRISMLDHG